MRLFLSPRVAGDLEEIAEYIARDSSRHAANLLRVLRARMEEIAQHPRLYQLRPEIAPEARLVAVGEYLILFRVRNDTVRIERVVHGSRDLHPVMGKVE
jgi:toxin ParE1/3/4